MSIKIEQVQQRKELQEEIDTLLKKHGDLESSSRIRESITKLTEKREALKPKLEQAQNKAKIIEKLEKLGEVKDCATELNEIKDALTAAQTELLTVHDQIENGSGALGKAVCPTCFQPVDPDKIGPEINRLKTTKKLLTFSIDKLKKEKSSLEDGIIKWQKSKELTAVLDSIKVVESYNELKTVLTETENLFDILKIKVKAAEQYEKMKEALALLCTDDPVSMLEEFEKITSKIQSLEERVLTANKYSVLKERLDKIEIRECTKQKENVEVDYNSNNDRLISISTNLEKLRRDIQNYRTDEETIKELRASFEKNEGTIKLVRYLNYLDKSLPVLKKHKLHEIVNAITEVLPKFIDVLFTEQSLSFVADETNEASVELMAKRPGGVWVPVKALSGGEKKRLSICLIWTLHMLARRHVGLLILDEIDNGLDLVGVEALKKLIEEKKSSVDTILLTSQRESVLGPYIDQTWSVIKNNNESRLIKGEVQC